MNPARISAAVLFVLGCLCASAKAEVGAHCSANDQCGDGECCEETNPLIASKREVIGRFAPFQRICGRYLQSGEDCGYFAGCGCGTGLTCELVQQRFPTDPNVQEKRKMAAPVTPYPPRDGFYWTQRCQHTQRFSK